MTEKQKKEKTKQSPETESADNSYEIKDKRRVNADGTLREEAKEFASETTKKDEFKAEAPKNEPPAVEDDEKGEVGDLSIYQYLQFVAGTIAHQAWQYMGLGVPQGRHEPIVDMGQAKIAIDTVVYIHDQIAPHINEEERKMFRNLISDLQINFVQRNK